MKKFFAWTLSLLTLLTFGAKAQDSTLYKKEVFKTTDGHQLPYRILFPKDYDKTKRYPLVLVLHGAGERGADNELQLKHGSKLFLEHMNDFPAIVVFPQCPEESFWSSVKINRENSTKARFAFDYTGTDFTWPLKAVVTLVKDLQKKEAVDSMRMYITGLSMGGMGTFELITREPDIFAAALPICGGGDATLVKNFAAKVPFWIFHGGDDPVVPPQLSRDMDAAIKEAGGTVKYTEYPGVGHDSWVNAFKEPQYLPWMFEQKKQ